MVEQAVSLKTGFTCERSGALLTMAGERRENALVLSLHQLKREPASPFLLTIHILWRLHKTELRLHSSLRPLNLHPDLSFERD